MRNELGKRQSSFDFLWRLGTQAETSYLITHGDVGYQEDQA